MKEKKHLTTLFSQIKFYQNKTPPLELLKASVDTNSYFFQLLKEKTIYYFESGDLKNVINDFPPPRNFRVTGNRVEFYRHTWQEIDSLNNFDEVLFSKGMNAVVPHEVLQIRLEGKFNVVHTEVIHGELSNVSGIEEMSRNIARLKEKLKKMGDEGQKIIISHTHPSIDIILIDGQYYSYLFGGLSEKDLNIGQSIFQLNCIPTTIEAISPNKWKYTVHFTK
ncbi:hypothetical protein N9N67_04985 [Bacteriovoracaceae bacterium]|nr:hypothetical protein [Bacteriovoracaceae bacterium]